MTVAEQILEAVLHLDDSRQREVLTLVRCLQAAPDIRLDDVDFAEPSSVDAWRDRMRTRAQWAVSEAMQRFRALGLVDADGRLVERELPADMQPDSKTSVAT